MAVILVLCVGGSFICQIGLLLVSGSGCGAKQSALVVVVPPVPLVLFGASFGA